MQIVFVSGHHPADTQFAQATRRMFTAYTQRHGYGFFYDDIPPESTEIHELHYRRCTSLQRAAETFPNTDWFVWVDSDVIVNKPERRVEDCIDLTDMNISYHLFHENPWNFPVNTGVKIVNANAISWEARLFSMRNTPPWNEFPYEQKVIAEYVIPILGDKCKIHDPYIMNHILYQLRYEYHNPADAMFVHVCGRSADQRNKIIGIFENEHRLMEHTEDPTIELF